MAMFILSHLICLSLGACIGLVGAGLCAVGSDKSLRRLNATAPPMDCDWESNEATLASVPFFAGENCLSRFEQVKGRSDASYATADWTD
jgi:hypothetical protein